MHVRRLAFTRTNEELVRACLFQHWEIYWAERRLKALRRLRSPNCTGTERRSLERERWVRQPAPVDLSGGCRLVAQVAHRVFALTGKVRSNQQHTFIVLASGEVYDLNRECRDVNAMRLYEQEPYRVELAYSNGLEATVSRASWRAYLAAVLSDLQSITATLPEKRFHRGPPLESLPSWGKVASEPHTECFEWQVHQKEINSHGQGPRSRPRR